MRMMEEHRERPRSLISWKGLLQIIFGLALIAAALILW
jgi:hypothetical protein